MPPPPRHTVEPHPQPSSLFPVWDLILIFLYAYFYVKSTNFSKELLSRFPFCNFTEHYFELSHLVIKIWWLSSCGFLVLFPSPTFICLYCLCIVQFWTARSLSQQLSLCRWEVQELATPSAPPLAPWLLPKCGYPREHLLELPVVRGVMTSFFPCIFPHGCWLPKARGTGSNPLCRESLSPTVLVLLSSGYVFLFNFLKLW